MHVCVCVCVQEPKEPEDSLELKLEVVVSCLICVLGAKLGSSGRKVNALNH